MQKFLTDTLESRYIKSLLYSNYLPHYSTVRKGDKIVEDNFYIYKLNIIECTKTGIIGQDAKFKIINQYDRYDPDIRVADTFLSKDKYYDSDTHERLGKFLRYYRDIKGIDLMSLYNCYSKRQNLEYNLLDDGLTSVRSDSYKIYQIPILFNHKYTVAIDCPGTVKMCPAILNEDDYVYSDEENLTSLLLLSNPIQVYASMQFLSPVIFEVNNENSRLQKYEENLALLIQLPSNNDSSIVVLEGDYTDKSRKRISLEKVSTYAEKDTLPKARIKGDIDCDGFIMQSDLLEIEKIISGQVTPDEITEWCADLNNDGEVTAADEEILTEYLSKHPSLLDENMEDYYDNWTWNPVLRRWWCELEVDTSEDIVDVSGYQVTNFEVVSDNLLKIFVRFPPITETPVWLSYASDVNYRGLNSIDDKEQDKLFLSSDISLLRMNDKQSYAFSDKLIQYLLRSAITSDENIFNNVKRIQEAVDINLYYTSVEDVWNDYLRKVLFDKYVDNNDYKMDILGYVDNDIEKYLEAKRSS